MKSRWFSSYSLFALLAIILEAVSPSMSAQPTAPPEGYSKTIPLSLVGASPSYGDMINLKNGDLLWMWGTGSSRQPVQPFYQNISTDGGKTWSAPVAAKLEDGSEMKGVFNTSLFRLKSGALGLIENPETRPKSIALFHVSLDEGKTWSKGVRIDPNADRSTSLTNGRVVVLASGRIVSPAYEVISSTPPVNKPMLNLFGEDFVTHRDYNLYYSFAYYSDDEGKTWTRSINEAFVSEHDGANGNFAFGEPSIAELSDGRLIMIGRTNLGRHYASYSGDQGVTWRRPVPTTLVCPPAPALVVRVPGTSDLMVVWNQVSPWETLMGLYRHRLTAAISKDGGLTWQHHRNLESLDDTKLIPPAPIASLPTGKYQQPIDRVRYHRAPGPIRISYPTIAFQGQNVVVTYGVAVFGDKKTITNTYGMKYEDVLEKSGLGPDERANVVRVLPLSWFYQ